MTGWVRLKAVRIRLWRKTWSWDMRKGICLIVFHFTALAAVNAGDLTFFTCSDTHYNETKELNVQQAALIDMMNTLPGREYPAKLGGGRIDVPKGVIIPGDLIDDGQGPKQMVLQEWALWEEDFGLTGEKRLKFPVYEGYGNHDLNAQYYVEDEIRKRNGKRADVTMAASNGYHYAWKWEGVHFVQLNLYPGDARPNGQPPRQALEFLKNFLAKIVSTSGAPVIISHHYQPIDNWWTDAEKEAYYSVIRGYNVVLIIHGHQNIASVTEWKGITVLNNHHFLRTGAFAVNIRDNEMRIIQRKPDDQWGISTNIMFKTP